MHKDLLAEIEKEIEEQNIHAVVVNHIIANISNSWMIGTPEKEMIEERIPTSHMAFVSNMNALNQKHEFLVYEDYKTFCLGLFKNNAYMEQLKNAIA